MCPLTRRKPALMKDEERQVGNVKWETYKLYITAATYITWVLAFILLGEPLGRGV